MASDAADGTDAGAGDADAAGASLVDRWTALDRGWQALALGVGIVAAHLVGQAL
ncbi:MULTISPECIES: hypothetical protein [Halorubrum]|uniref:Uncharacterized protein n=1 Tax=Halorubrum salinarum TaxID=2739057 RepID=A0A7D4BPC1_9EURY|nr:MULTISPECIES: hypothetical protein [Halorubrum]QKG92097.1 hypothetical protein HPS36_04275 [Halorubrum salinarum]